MKEIRVYAPQRQEVRLQLENGELRMQADANGWWQATLQADAGTDYQFVLDGDGPYPDPRSAWQPHGVHGPSRLVDHHSFVWSDAHWQPPAFESGIVYELHVGTLSKSGTFRGAIAHLDHLVHLGITHVELMPVQEFSGPRGWGYDGVDLFAPHHAYGTPDDLKALVDACHGHGLAVLLDVVYNHLGPCGNYLSRFGPYFTDHYRTPWGEAVNFDGPGSPEVRRFFCDNACMWLRDYHFDGLRLDAVHAIVDVSARHFLEQLQSEVEDLQQHLGRRLMLIAENDLNDARVVWPPARGGYGLTAQWNDDFHHALHALLTGERDGYYADFGSVADVATALRQGYVYAGRYSHFRRRIQGRADSDLSGHACVVYLQNHDQIGNRARGERISDLVDAGSLKIGAALVLLGPFVPLIFQGEEWGASTPFQYFTAHEDADLAQRVRAGRAQEFAQFNWPPEAIPDPQDPQTFADSCLDWSELHLARHPEVLDWYRRLIALRKRLPELTDGRLDRLELRYDEAGGWLVFTRTPVAVACNFSNEPRRVELDAGRYVLQLASQGTIQCWNQYVDLPARSVAVLMQE